MVDINRHRFFLVQKEDIVYRKVRQILIRYGKIFDEAKKFYGPLIVLD